MAVIFGGWALIILGRLLWLQVITHGQFVDWPRASNSAL